MVKLDVRANQREVLETTIATMREKDAETDQERVDALLGAYRGNGLGVVGLDATRRALEMGQVDELIITADPAAITAPGAGQPAEQPERTAAEGAANELIVKARQTAAKVRFIEKADLLAPIGGVGALLRYTV